MERRAKEGDEPPGGWKGESPFPGWQRRALAHVGIFPLGKLAYQSVYSYGEGGMRKTLLAFTADTLQKIGIAGIALGIYQNKSFAVILGGIFLAAAYGFKIWEMKK